jgi:hypothetical protein
MGDGQNADGSIAFKANKKVTLWEEPNQGSWKVLDNRKFQITSDGEKEVYEF